MLALVFDILQQELPCGSDVGVEAVGVDAVDGGAASVTFWLWAVVFPCGAGVGVEAAVGGTTVTLWLLQLWPVQHSMLQSSKVQF